MLIPRNNSIVVSNSLSTAAEVSWHQWQVVTVLHDEGYGFYLFEQWSEGYNHAMIFRFG